MKGHDLLSKHANMFAKSHTDLGQTSLVEFDIDTGNNRLYKTLLAMRESIQSQIKDMLKAGVIKSSTSPLASPVVIVPKKDGGWRFCI